MIPTDTFLTADSAASVATDSDSIAAVVGETLSGILLEPPHKGEAQQLRPGLGSGASWLMLGVVAVFCIVCARYKSNWKYFKVLLHDLTTVKARGNVFDDTVKETSFIFLLNTLGAVALGLLLYVFLPVYFPGNFETTSLPPASFGWICIGLCAAYSVVMPVAYWVSGSVFADAVQTRMWVRGFLASQALLGLLLIAPAMIALFNPASMTSIAIISVCIFGIVKIIFICKGFRIFFMQYSSWILFLYYLCILEAIPLLATCTCALYFA